MFFATLIGIVMGILSAVNKGSFYDNSTFIIAVTGMSAPSFFMATIISTVGGLKMGGANGFTCIPINDTSFRAINWHYYLFQAK